MCLTLIPIPKNGGHQLIHRSNLRFLLIPLKVHPYSGDIRFLLDVVLRRPAALDSAGTMKTAHLTLPDSPTQHRSHPARRFDPQESTIV